MQLTAAHATAYGVLPHHPNPQAALLLTAADCASDLDYRTPLGSLSNAEREQADGSTEKLVSWQSKCEHVHSATSTSLQTGEPPDKRQKRAVARPGVPQPTRKSAFVVPNRPSPPERPPDKDGHFVFELGDNLTSRCEYTACLYNICRACLSQATDTEWHRAHGSKGTLTTSICCVFTDKILSKMGEGTFGRVLECWDRKKKDYCAIKVVRAIRKYRDAAMIEVMSCGDDCCSAMPLSVWLVGPGYGPSPNLAVVRQRWTQFRAINVCHS